LAFLTGWIMLVRRRIWTISGDSVLVSIVVIDCS
jgi:hypothetical protein